MEFAEDNASDPFGLDQFLSEAKQAHSWHGHISMRPLLSDTIGHGLQAKALEKIGDGAGMSASAGGSMGESGRSRIDFKPSR